MILASHITERHTSTILNRLQHSEAQSKDDSIYQCGLCGEERNSLRSNQNHLLCIHIVCDGDGMFSCNECSHKCGRKADLWKHFKSVHNDDLEEDNDDRESQLCFGDCEYATRADAELKQLRNPKERIWK